MAPNNFPTLTSSSATTNKASIRYEECLHNFGAKKGRYIFDGCGEFMKKGDEDSTGTSEPFICDACGCHRNFHHRIEPKKQPLVHRPSQSTSVTPLHLYRHNLIMRATARQARAQAQAQAQNGIIGVVSVGGLIGWYSSEETSSEGSELGLLPQRNTST